MRVELRIEARKDLVEAAFFYDRQREGLGERFIGCIRAELHELESRAGIHESVHGFHRMLVDRFPFAIYYQVLDSIVDVVAVLDCRRDPEVTANRLGQS